MNMVADHLVSLQNPGADLSGLRPPWIPAENHFAGYFYDVDVSAHPEAPTENDIRLLIDWLTPRCSSPSSDSYIDNEACEEAITDLWCLSLATGATELKIPLELENFSSLVPAVTTNGIWIDDGFDGGLSKFNLNGTQQFSTNWPQEQSFTPAIGPDGTVYTWDANSFIAYNPASGAPLCEVDPGIQARG